MIPMLLSSGQYFNMILTPTLKVKRFSKLKVAYNVVRRLTNDEALGDEYVLLKSGGLTGRLAFEPYYLRMSVADDPVKLCAFFAEVTSGRRHPSTFAFLLSPWHQAEIKAGKVAPFKPLVRKPVGLPEDKPSDKLDRDFNEAVRLDDDYRRVAKKRDFDGVQQTKILLERGDYLLERKK